MHTLPSMSNVADVISESDIEEINISELTISEPAAIALENLSDTDNDSESDQEEEYDEFITNKIHLNVFMVLGPNYKYHIEQELKSRFPEYVFFADYPEELKAKPETRDPITRMIYAILPDIQACRNIQNPDVLEAIYNWMPSYRVRDLSEAHPDWKIHTFTEFGMCCVYNVGKNLDTGFYGIDIPYSKLDHREEAFGEAVHKALKTNVNKWLCAQCNHKTPMYTRKRSYLFEDDGKKACSEKFQATCSKCKAKKMFTIEFN